MPIFDYRCDGCGKEKKDEFVAKWDEDVICSCGRTMEKLPSLFHADVFPSEGLFLEHVSAEGKTFYSKAEMRQYAKDHDLELGAL
jgi:predicted nucleic acid-binding Zn ribbon protein